jgi:hypothetical protein
MPRQARQDILNAEKLPNHAMFPFEMLSVFRKLAEAIDLNLFPS